MKKRLSVDFDIEKHSESIVWDYMENTGVIKSKWIKNILTQFVLGTLDVPSATETKETTIEYDSELTEDDIDFDNMEGF